ncbi:universal stress protein [Pseudorhodobacter sp.]|uniref:universal stress protein n=1 Tax=Pseudorhodobacter sp. TaxID=1934400 RepID=UPI0039E21FAD
MFQHILVAIAFDEEKDPERALQVAAKLADGPTRVTVLHVKDEVPSYAIAYMPEDYDLGLKQAIYDQLSVLAKRFENGRAVLIEGHSGRTILDWAEKNDVDCIVLNSHKPNITDYFLGGTATVVVRHAKCSVHVIR